MTGDSNPTTNYKDSDKDQPLQIVAYMFAGLAMMLNIRLSYSAAPYALLRFKLPENLFSVFVRTTSSALELWCIPSMLIGNIMEQVYNQTQDIPSYHDIGLKNYDNAIESKAQAVSSTAERKSTQELSTTRDNDIQTEKLGGQLNVKSTELKKKAELLYNAAESLRSEAATQNPQSSLEPLKNDAESLRDKAGNSAVGETLFGAAHALANHPSGSSPEGKATGVIEKFEAVQGAYKGLMSKAKQISQQGHSKVTAVDEAYNQLKDIYDGMLNLTKLAKAANELSRQAGGTLQGAAEQLGNNVTALRDNTDSGQNYAKAQTVIQEFEKVENAYKALSEGEKTSVQTHFEALKNLYDKIFKFTKVRHYSDKLNTAAGSGDTTDVIKYFNSVAAAYELLGDDKSQVKSQFEELKTEYSNAIYFYKKCIITIPSIVTNWLNFLTFVILFIVYVAGGDQGNVTAYYIVIAISGFVFGINMVLVYAVDYRYLPFYMAGENSFPMVTSLILYFATSIFGNRRKYNSDYLVVLIDISIAILIAFVASVLWTVAFKDYRAPKYGGLTPDPWPLVSPVAMVIVGMGLVYSIYPGIAPGMIVPFYLIDKIEMVLLVATAFPPVIIAILRLKAENWSPSTKFLLTTFSMAGWKTYTDNDKVTTVHAWIWHLFDILIPLKIALAIIFIYSLHYRDSSIARSIINQPKMSTALTITFYMCHEILLALGFPGMVANGGAGGAVLLPTQYAGALLMVFLAFYSIGYITEYKKHDPSQWPTEGMTKWNALCYWLKMASKITNKNFKQLFTTDLRRDLLLCIQKNELI